MITNKSLKNSRGFTILEVLIAVLISGIIMAAGFQFFSKVSYQSEVQFDVSEMQNLCRISMYDMRKTLRSAGYLVDGVPCEINGDSLAVYYSSTQPVDTTTYFLEEYTDSAYQTVPGIVAGLKLYCLMKQINGTPPTIYADCITDLNFAQIDSANILITITTQVPRTDDTYSGNDGFRTFTLTERVNMRNVN